MLIYGRQVEKKLFDERKILSLNAFLNNLFREYFMRTTRGNKTDFDCSLFLSNLYSSFH